MTIDSEAEGEPYQAKVGVAEVIRNRMQRKYSSDGTVAGTVLKRLQFSAWQASNPQDEKNRIRAVQVDVVDPNVMDCVRAWAAAQAGSDNVSGAVLFYAVGIPPPVWARQENFTGQFGRLRFYRA